MTRKIFEMKVLVEGNKCIARGKYAEDVTPAELKAILEHIETAGLRTAVKGLAKTLS